MILSPRLSASESYCGVAHLASPRRSWPTAWGWIPARWEDGRQKKGSRREKTDEGYLPSWPTGSRARGKLNGSAHDCRYSAVFLSLVYSGPKQVDDTQCRCLTGLPQGGSLRVGASHTSCSSVTVLAP